MSQASPIMTAPTDRTDQKPSARRPMILVVEDGPAEREALARVLRLEDYQVLTARNPEHALTLFDQPISMVISDLKMGIRSGIDLLRAWLARRPETPFIIVTAYGDVESAVEAMKIGARDFMTKPIDPTKLLEMVKRCLETPATAHVGPVAGMTPLPGVDARLDVERMVGVSDPIRRVRDQIRRVAPSDSTVLLLGESGTGKELAAEAVHAHSTRSSKPLVVVNMAAVPESLVESELFGHVKGAFTGASADRPGRFEIADGGTLFIDEVGDFPLSLQAKLLRALETRVIQRVGGNDDRTVNVRLVAATSRNVREMVRQGKFREDLYYRLNVVTIEIPPLRERREDIPLLLEHFAANIAPPLGKPIPTFDANLQGFLISYDWPGNIRELRNCLESMIVLSRGPELTLEDLPPNLATGLRAGASTEESSASDDLQLSRLEKSVILQTLKRMEGNRTKAAEALGISVRTLQRRLKEWGGEV
ncbi:MAG: sigma-54-dependent Fis family transcriptional regulator [Planctomycetales bacterium]|nr:sigma-54-dependent Fis family transcriptional regulator [Planctomycetales bacterium]